MRKPVILSAALAGVLLSVLGALILWLPLYNDWQTSEADLTDSEARLAALSAAAPKPRLVAAPSAVYHAPIHTLLLQAQASGIKVSAVEVPEAADSSLGIHITGEASLPAFEAWLRHSQQWRFKRLTLTSLNNGRVSFQFYAQAGVAEVASALVAASIINPFCQQLPLSEAAAAAATPLSQRVSWRALQFAGSAKQHGSMFGLLTLPTGALITVQVGDLIGLELVRVTKVTQRMVAVCDAQNQEKIIGEANA